MPLREDGLVTYHADIGVVEVCLRVCVGDDDVGYLAVCVGELFLQWHIVPDGIVAFAPALLEAGDGIGAAFVRQADVVAPAVVAVEVDGVVAKPAVDVIAFAAVNGVVIPAADKRVGKAAL